MTMLADGARAAEPTTKRICIELEWYSLFQKLLKKSEDDELIKDHDQGSDEDDDQTCKRQKSIAYMRSK